MLAQLQGIKTTLVSIITVCLVFFLITQLSSYWQPWLDASQTLVYILAVVTFLFAAQFSRSRFSLLAVFWLLLYLSLEYKFTWLSQADLGLVTLTNGDIRQSSWLMLIGIFWLGALSLIKNRGLLSVHSLTRILLFFIVIGLAYVWLWAVAILQQNYQAQYGWLAYFAIELPILLTSLLVCWKSIKSANLFASAVASTLIIWCLYYYQLLQLPWSITVAVLLCHYLLAVIIDSYFLAYRDELTELPSRRALQQLVLSLGRNYTVAMLDVDHFKKFNDTYGHDIGDQVLKLVASKLAKVKSGGRVFRYGGEEFTVVFPRKSIEQTWHELDQLRQAIADYQMVIRQPQRKNKEARNKGKGKNAEMKTVSVTISIGVAMREPKQSFEQVLKASDQALYRAKKAGRNKVCE